MKAKPITYWQGAQGALAALAMAVTAIERRLESRRA